jgi:hypothetical protein
MEETKMKTMKMPKDRFNKLADERELRCPNATYILINGDERDKGVLLAIRHCISTRNTDILDVVLMK